jgi:hypothetical protein
MTFEYRGWSVQIFCDQNVPGVSRAYSVYVTSPGSPWAKNVWLAGNEDEGQTRAKEIVDAMISAGEGT